MYQRDYRDIVGGTLLVVGGAIIVYHATTTMSLGTIRQMGPGFFPAALGYMMAGFGLMILVPAFFRPGTLETFELRSSLAVLGSVAAFAGTIVPLGLIPAIVALVVVASLAEPVFRPLAVLAMAVALPVTAYLIFYVGLGLPIELYRLPF